MAEIHPLYFTVYSNGVNRVKEGYSWSNLIDDLIEDTGSAGLIDKGGTPFPLLYEQIYANSIEKQKHTELNIKQMTYIHPCIELLYIQEDLS